MSGSVQRALVFDGQVRVWPFGPVPTSTGRGPVGPQVSGYTSGRKRGPSGTWFLKFLLPSMLMTHRVLMGSLLSPGAHEGSSGECRSDRA